MKSQKETSFIFNTASISTALICGILFVIFCFHQYHTETVRLNKHLLGALNSTVTSNSVYLRNVVRQIQRFKVTRVNSKQVYQGFNLPYEIYTKTGKKVGKFSFFEGLPKKLEKPSVTDLNQTNDVILLPSINNDFLTVQWLPACKGAKNDSNIICLFKDASFITDALKYRYSYEKTRIQIFRSDGQIIFDSQNSTPNLDSNISYAEIVKELNQVARKNNGRFNSGLSFLPSDYLGYVNWNEEFNTFTVTSAPKYYILDFLSENFVIPFLLLAIVFAFLIWSYNRYKKITLSYHSIKSEMSKLKIQNQDTVSLVTEHMPGIIYRVLPPNEMLFVSQNSFEFLGVRAGDIYKSERLISDFIYQEDKEKYQSKIEQYAKTFSKFEMSYRIITANNETKWVLDRGRFFLNKNQNVVLEGMLLDISEHMASQKKIEYLATFDPLTNLKNRFMFNEELLSNLKNEKNKEWALIFIDLDRFKNINDSLGHHVGDKLLKVAADRLRTTLGTDALIARMGADEFIALIKQPGNRIGAGRIAERIMASISKLYRIDYYKLSTTCSVGISMFPEDTQDSKALLRNADTAMLFAKSDGGNCLRFYNDEMKSKINLRLTMENELKLALAENQFEIFYQPQVCTKTFEIQGAEALIRWRHPKRGLISPVDFIPIAEDTGLIIDIGNWILEESCHQFKQWNEKLSKPIRVSVNLSAKQLNPDLLDKIIEIINKTGISVNALELEITETLLMNNIEENIKVLEELSQFGIDISLDDFGTGYSSLSYLKKFPINNLKIDRSFTMSVNEDQDSRAIVETIVAMAKILRLKTIVEGIEDENQMKVIDTFGCDLYQGYYFSKPIPAKAFYNTYIQPIMTKKLQQPEGL